MYSFVMGISDRHVQQDMWCTQSGVCWDSQHCHVH